MTGQVSMEEVGVPHFVLSFFLSFFDFVYFIQIVPGDSGCAIWCRMESAYVTSPALLNSTPNSFLCPCWYRDNQVFFSWVNINLQVVIPPLVSFKKHAS